MPIENISLEFFPTKEGQAIDTTPISSSDFGTSRPFAFYSVTSGALGSNKRGTTETIESLSHLSRSGFAHIPCIGMTRGEIRAILDDYIGRDIKNFVALRGDRPSGTLAKGEFQYAQDLIILMREEYPQIDQIAVAGYPEKHPEAKNIIQDVEALRSKVASGANMVITQSFYDPNAFYDFRNLAVQKGIEVPIIPGILPIGKDLVRFIKMVEGCGASIPKYMLAQLQGYVDMNDRDGYEEYAMGIIVRLIDQLESSGIEDIHIYTINNSLRTAKILMQTLPSHRIPAYVSEVTPNE